MLCTSYKNGNKNPLLLSADVTTKKNKTARKPKVVATYNKVMGGIDLQDAKLYAYLNERKTIKWTTKAFLSLLGTVVLNSSILYAKRTSHRVILSRFRFMMSISQALVGH